MAKAAGAREAGRMLGQMSGQRLDVVTSIAMKKPGKAGFLVWTERGWVRFRKLGKGEMARYLASKRWKGKAAAVNVEEKPVKNWIEKKGGEQGAVVGLPLKRLRKEIGKC